MNDLIKAIVERIAGWPDEAIAELLRTIDSIEIRHSLVYRLSDDERAAVREGLAQTTRNEFVGDEIVAAYFAKFRA